MGPRPQRARWFSSRYLAEIWAKPPARALAILGAIAVIGLLIFVFASGQETTTFSGTDFTAAPKSGVTVNSNGTAQLTAVTGTGNSCGTMTGAHTFSHVIVIMEENSSFSSIYKSSSAPFINTLMQSCSAWQAAGATDPSEPNYQAATQGYFGNEKGNCIQCSSNSDNIFHALDAAGKSWAAVEETMPGPCSGSTAFPYKRGHNPPYWMTDLTASGDGSCAQNDLPGSTLPKTLPALTWVTPNMCDDMHWQTGSAGDCGKYLGVADTATQRFTVGDNWLKNFLNTQVFTRADYQAGQDLVILTWDEGNEGGSVSYQDCTTTANYTAHNSCQITTVLIDPYAKGGTVVWSSGKTLYSHYSILKTMEKELGVTINPKPSPVPQFWNSYLNAPLLPD